MQFKYFALCVGLVAANYGQQCTFEIKYSDGQSVSLDSVSPYHEEPHPTLAVKCPSEYSGATLQVYDRRSGIDRKHAYEFELEKDREGWFKKSDPTINVRVDMQNLQMLMIQSSKSLTQWINPEIAQFKSGLLLDPSIKVALGSDAHTNQVLVKADEEYRKLREEYMSSLDEINRHITPEDAAERAVAIINRIKVVSTFTDNVALYEAYNAAANGMPQVRRDKSINEQNVEQLRAILQAMELSNAMPTPGGARASVQAHHNDNAMPTPGGARALVQAQHNDNAMPTPGGARASVQAQHNDNIMPSPGGSRAAVHARQTADAIPTPGGARAAVEARHQESSAMPSARGSRAAVATRHLELEQRAKYQELREDFNFEIVKAFYTAF